MNIKGELSKFKRKETFSFTGIPRSNSIKRQPSPSRTKKILFSNNMSSSEELNETGSTAKIVTKPNRTIKQARQPIKQEDINSDMFGLFENIEVFSPAMKSHISRCCSKLNLIKREGEDRKIYDESQIWLKMKEENTRILAEEFKQIVPRTGRSVAL